MILLCIQKVSCKLAVQRYSKVSIKCPVLLTYRLGGKKAQNGIPGIILHFSLEPSYGYLRFEGNKKIPLGRQGIWRGKECALNRHTQILISTHFHDRPRWQNWLGLHSANYMIVGSNPTACISKFCCFFIFALPFFLFFPRFPYLPKGIFPFPSNLKQPQLGSNGKCKIKPGITFWGWTPSFFFSKMIC